MPSRSYLVVSAYSGAELRGQPTKALIDAQDRRPSDAIPAYRDRSGRWAPFTRGVKAPTFERTLVYVSPATPRR